VQFRQRKGTENLERYVTGLLNEHPNKNCETLASVVPVTHPQRLHNLLTDLAWEEADFNRQRIERLLELKTEGDAKLLLDDTGFGKKGRHSVGIARQYSGTFGKVSNCQVTVKGAPKSTPPDTRCFFLHGTARLSQRYIAMWSSGCATRRFKS
jgi:SRSO17 transposase